SPVYFFGSMTLGGLMQRSSAFGQVQSALSFFVTAYTSIADWKAVLNRLAGFDASIGWAEGLDGTAPRVEGVAERARHLSRRDPSRRRPHFLRRRSFRRTAQRPADRAGRWVLDRARRAGAGDGAIRLGQDQPVPRTRRRLAGRRAAGAHPQGGERACAAAK